MQWIYSMGATLVKAFFKKVASSANDPIIEPTIEMSKAERIRTMLVEYLAGEYTVEMIEDPVNEADLDDEKRKYYTLATANPTTAYLLKVKRSAGGIYTLCNRNSPILEYFVLFIQKSGMGIPPEVTSDDFKQIVEDFKVGIHSPHFMCNACESKRETFIYICACGYKVCPECELDHIYKEILASKSDKIKCQKCQRVQNALNANDETTYKELLSLLRGEIKRYLKFNMIRDHIGWRFKNEIDRLIADA